MGNGILSVQGFLPVGGFHPAVFHEESIAGVKSPVGLRSSWSFLLKGVRIRLGVGSTMGAANVPLAVGKSCGTSSSLSPSEQCGETRWKVA